MQERILRRARIRRTHSPGGRYRVDCPRRVCSFARSRQSFCPRFALKPTPRPPVRHAPMVVEPLERRALLSATMPVASDLLAPMAGSQPVGSLTGKVVYLSGGRRVRLLQRALEHRPRQQQRRRRGLRQPGPAPALRRLRPAQRRHRRGAAADRAPDQRGRARQRRRRRHLQRRVEQQLGGRVLRQRRRRAVPLRRRRFDRDGDRDLPPEPARRGVLPRLHLGPRRHRPHQPALPRPPLRR